MKKVFAFSLLALVLPSLWFATGHKPFGACWSRMTAPRAQEIPGKYVVLVERRDIDYSIDVAGDVAPEFQLEVKSEVGGKIKAIHVEPGQKVKGGMRFVKLTTRICRTKRPASWWRSTAGSCW